MSAHYRPRRIKPWRVLAGAVRLLAMLIKAWPLALLTFVLLSPVTPHMLWEYTYTELGQHRVYQRCRYLGIRGWVNHRPGADCPFIALINHQAMDD